MTVVRTKPFLSYVVHLEGFSPKKVYILTNFGSFEFIHTLLALKA
jgi:hypothetical protein